MAPDAAERAVALISQLSGAPRKAAQDRLAAARAALAPVAAEAKAELDALAAVRKELGPTLERWAAIDWGTAVLHLGRGRHAVAGSAAVSRAERAVRDARSLLDAAAHELAQIDDRIENLAADDLNTGIFPEEVGLPRGSGPIGPRRIQVTVATYMNAAAAVRSHFRAAEVALGEVERSLQGAREDRANEEPTGTFTALRSEDDDHKPPQEYAETAFSVFESPEAQHRATVDAPRVKDIEQQPAAPEGE